MEIKAARKTALVIFGVLLGVVVLTYFISFLVRGYRPDLNKQGLGFLPTGLLVANSDPKGASVHIDGKLATATDDTLNLSPDEYQVKIEKDGFLPWEKKLTIKKEVVTQADAVLFRSAPDLKPLTNTGAINPTLSPDKSKIVYGVTKASTSKKNGLWLLDLGSSTGLTRASTRQLTEPITNFDWENSQFKWSPDNKEVILISRDPKTEAALDAYLIDISRFIPQETLIDVSFRLSLILKEWEEQEKAELEIKLARLPKKLAEIASNSAEMISFSPDEERFFYLALNSAAIPENLLPHPPARSTQPETRQIETDKIYNYNLKEDTNFLIGSNQNLPFYWLTSDCLIYIDQEKSQIKVVEADGGNNQTIYSGPFENGFIFPSPAGKSLVVLISLHSESPANLYEIKVR